MKKYCFKSILVLAALMTFCPVMAEEPIYNMPDQRRGDVNKDGNVDISDIVAVINHISGNVHYIFSNVNGDEHVDISDITAIINIISDSSEPDLLEWEDLGTGTFTDNFWEEGSCSVEFSNVRITQMSIALLTHMDNSVKNTTMTAVQFSSISRFSILVTTCSEQKSHSPNWCILSRSTPVTCIHHIKAT